MRRMFVSSTLLAVVSLTVLVSVPPVHSQSKPKAGKAVAAAPGSYGNVDSICEEEMKIYLYFLASDQLEGRNLPSRGLDTAALYIASHLAEWGLKPGGSTAKTTGPLRQGRGRRTSQLWQRGLDRRRRDEDLPLLSGLRSARRAEPAVARSRYGGALHRQPPGGVERRRI